MIAAFEGWSDAADAASGAVAWLRHRLHATRFAWLEPDDYYDFQATRPAVRLADGVIGNLRWPANEFAAANVDGRDYVIVSGVEPNLRWRSYCRTVIDVARETGCDMVVTLGALLADVPHTRPIRLTGTSADPGLLARLGLQRSRYEGPTGIVGVLHDACQNAGLASMSLWASVPHYVGAPPNPKATAALLEQLGMLLAMPVDAGDLHTAADVWERRVTELVDADDDVAAYVRRLELRADAPDADDDDDVPSGDEIADELERFLRQSRDEDED